VSDPNFEGMAVFTPVINGKPPQIGEVKKSFQAERPDTVSKAFCHMVKVVKGFI